MKDLLILITKSIVDNPDKVVVEESVDAEGTIVLTLTVDPTDMGKIIGKQGKIINSIRTIIRILAIKEGKKVKVELTEVPGYEKAPQTELPQDTTENSVSGVIDMSQDASSDK